MDQEDHAPESVLLFAAQNLNSSHGAGLPLRRSCVFQESCPRWRLVASLHHALEQLELARPQINRMVATLRNLSDEIEFQCAYPEHRIAAF